MTILLGIENGRIQTVPSNILDILKSFVVLWENCNNLHKIHTKSSRFVFHRPGNHNREKGKLNLRNSIYFHLCLQHSTYFLCYPRK